MATDILIAEDEPSILEALNFVLLRAGWTVQAVTDGEAVMNAVRRERPRVLVLDIMLPKRSGFEVLKQIRADAAARTLPVLVLTAVFGRWAMAYAISAFPYAHKEGLGKAFKDAAGRPGLCIATLITLVLAVLLTWWAGLRYYYLAGIAVLVLWLFVTLLATYFRHKFAGLTGDTYGAINELAETGTLLLFSIIAWNGLFV